jgi:plasmid maintenance system antidote protein VapI
MYRNVKAEMARRGITLGMLADQLKFTLATVSNKLNGKQPLTFNEAKQIKSILGVDMPLEELFEEYTEAV